MVIIAIILYIIPIKLSILSTIVDIYEGIIDNIMNDIISVITIILISFLLSIIPIMLSIISTKVDEYEDIIDNTKNGIIYHMPYNAIWVCL